ncbi:hypothetical protein [Euzebyella saccharophila]|uniref:Uncharacterized protein n=1 Tax=Euzebyella saccharophila TaxID=679664 RepID=A0ABV8JPD4_9FLAO|nr:hypothetical protein [Euzebyella saccharophila]
MKILYKYILTFIVLISSVTSCVEEQDFDQYDDISVTPTYEASMLYVEAPEEMVNQAPSNQVFIQNFNFDAFSYKTFAERVLDGSITYIIENTTSKPLEIMVEFLDDQGNVLGPVERFDIDPAPTAVLQREVAYGDAGRPIDIITNTSSIRVSTTNLGDTTSVSNEDDPKIIVKSSAKFRVRLK